MTVSNERLTELRGKAALTPYSTVRIVQREALAILTELLERRTSQPVAWRHVLVHPDGYDFDWQVDQKPDHPYGLSDGYTAVTTPLFASPPSQGEPVAVKGLEWKAGRPDTRQHETVRWEASSLLGAYTAYEIYGNCWYETPTHNDFNARPTASIDAAKAAAQADYEQRIRSALSPAPSLAVSDEMLGPKWVQNLAARISVDVCEIERDSPEDDPMACAVYAPEIDAIVIRRVTEALSNIRGHNG